MWEEEEAGTVAKGQAGARGRALRSHGEGTLSSPEALGYAGRGHAEAQAGSAAAHRMMVATVFSLAGEEGSELSPNSFFSDPSSF